MASLSAGDRIAGNNTFMQERNAVRDSLELTKANLKAAYDAANTWADSVQAAYNSALPLPARTSLTTQQKAKLLIAVLERRYLSGV